MTKPSRNNRSKSKFELDYNYGSDPTPKDDNTVNEPKNDKTDFSDELIIGSRSTEKLALKNKKREEDIKKTETRIARTKYLGYLDYQRMKEKKKLENGGDEAETHGEGESFENLSIKSWNVFIGFTCIRIVAPVFLILHTISIIFVFWKVYNFSFDKELNGVMPIIMVPISLNLMLVHYINKWLFSNNYYKLRY